MARYTASGPRAMPLPEKHLVSSRRQAGRRGRTCGRGRTARVAPSGPWGTLRWAMLQGRCLGRDGRWPEAESLCEGHTLNASRERGQPIVPASREGKAESSHRATEFTNETEKRKPGRSVGKSGSVTAEDFCPSAGTPGTARNRRRPLHSDKPPAATTQTETANPPE